MLNKPLPVPFLKIISDPSLDYKVIHLFTFEAVSMLDTRQGNLERSVHTSWYFPDSV